MDGYNIGNLAVTQGRYTNIVSTPQYTAAVPERMKKELSEALSGSQQPPALTEQEIKVSGENTPENQQDKAAGALEEQKAKYEDITQDEEKMNSITEILNEFMAQFNANLRFSLHKDTSMLTVQFVDMKENKVLKEFPPEEYLDMIANIRKYIGTIIDKKV